MFFLMPLLAVGCRIAVVKGVVLVIARKLLLGLFVDGRLSLCRDLQNCWGYVCGLSMATGGR